MARTPGAFVWSKVLAPPLLPHPRTSFPPPPPPPPLLALSDFLSPHQIRDQLHSLCTVMSAAQSTLPQHCRHYNQVLVLNRFLPQQPPASRSSLLYCSFPTPISNSRPSCSSTCTPE
jgi:hypothetical protein